MAVNYYSQWYRTTGGRGRGLVAMRSRIQCEAEWAAGRAAAALLHDSKVFQGRRFIRTARGGTLDYRILAGAKARPLSFWRAVWLTIRRQDWPMDWDVHNFAGSQYQWIVTEGLSMYEEDFLLGRLRNPSGGPVYFNGKRYG